MFQLSTTLVCTVLHAAEHLKCVAFNKYQVCCFFTFFHLVRQNRLICQLTSAIHSDFMQKYSTFFSRINEAAIAAGR